MAYFCELWFQWQFNFQGLCGLFWSTWLIWYCSTGPCWSCLRDWPGLWCLLVEEGDLRPLGGGLPGRATCLGGIPFSSVASCSPATPLNVRKGEESQAHGDKGASQAQITCCIGRIPLFVPPGHLSQAEQGREVSDAMGESTSHDHIPLWVSYQSPFWMLG